MPTIEHGQVGERGTQVRLLEHEYQRDADQRDDLPDVTPAHLFADTCPEEARGDEDEHELHPLRRLEVDASAEVDPAPGAEHLLADVRDEDRNQRDDADAIGPGRDVEQAVVVDGRDDEHQHEADGDELDLLLPGSRETWSWRSRSGFRHADHGHNQYEAEQGPVEVAESRKVSWLLSARLNRRAWRFLPRDSPFAAPEFAGFGSGRFGDLHQVAGACALLGDVSVDDLSGQLGGVVAPVAMLPQDCDDDVRVAARRHAHEPCVRHGVVAFVRGRERVVAHDLRGAGLAGKVDAVKTSLRCRADRDSG